MIKLGVDRFIISNEFAGNRKVFDNSTRRYQWRHNVRRLQELQKHELCGYHIATGHDSLWQYRKLVVYVWNGLYDHEKSSGPRKGAIWYGQSDSELASARESHQTLISITLSFFSCALSSKNGNNEKESCVKTQVSNLEVTISDKDEQSFLTGTLKKKVNALSKYDPLPEDIQQIDANTAYSTVEGRLKYVQKLLRKGKKIAIDTLQPTDSREIRYIFPKETNKTQDRIRHESLNASRISESLVVTKSIEGKREDEENQEDTKTKEKLVREEKSSNVSLKDTNDQYDISKLLIIARNITSQNVKLIQERNGNGEADKNLDIGGALSEKYFAKQSDKNPPRVNDALAEMQNVTVDLKIRNNTAESRTGYEENWESGESDIVEAANFGLQAMHDLYYIQEPKLYSMGLYLKNDDPARYVAAFNDQLEEARDLARFGYAALQGTVMLLKKFPGAPLELPLSRNTQRTSLEQHCPRRGTPQCPSASLRYRTSDGSCNNLQNLWWGSAMSAMHRFLPAVYQDGVQSIRRSKNGQPLPSARDITNLIHEDKDVPLASVTHMLMQWGQFVDHDLTATGQSRGFNGTVPQCCLPGGVGFQPPEFMHPECLPIAVNLRDNFYGPLGVRCLEFLRSGPAPKEGCGFGSREQLSQVTSYLDASTVYSSNALHSDSLRIFRNGLLQYGRIQSRRPFLPKFESDLCKRGSLSTTCFRAGDGRLSEQPALTSLHIVFLRLHNRIATELSAANLHWSDERLFQETRKIVGAVVQHITYREFLPIILGPRVMEIFDLDVLKKGYYENYDPTVNPTIANAFSTAAYRFGHSLVQRSFVRFDSDHRPLFNNVSIHNEFSNPANLETPGSVDRILLGLVNQPCQRRDEFITEEITNHLFQTPSFPFGMDLASLNIQRGRDHGLPPYVRWRELCGLSPVRTFEDLDRVMSLNAARKFRSLYSSVEDIDLFPAGLAEKSVVGGLVGPTFACIIGQQFSNLRRGDRFWYENHDDKSGFTVDQLQQIRRVTLAQVLCKTIDGIKTVQPFVFLATDTLKNQRLACDDPAIEHMNLEFWTERSFDSRNNANVPQNMKRTTNEADDNPIFRSGGENSNLKRRTNNQGQAKHTTQKPSSNNNIRQNNRIVVKRPFGRPDNLTIVVQNNAVNSPVFVNDGIYGSNIKIQQHPLAKPTAGFNQGANYYPTQWPQMKPIPTAIPYSTSFHAGHPYVPHAFEDPSNPNPLAYGYRSYATATRGDIFYDNYPLSSPRPTLYTYYTTFQQKLSTQMPTRVVDGHLINYGSSHDDSVPAHNYERPKLPVNTKHELNIKQRPAQIPDYGKPAANAWLNSNPDRTSNDETYHGIKPPTISRPNFRPDYESNNGPYEEQKLEHNILKPVKPISLNNPRPNDELYYAQKPVYDGFASSANLRPDFKPNHQSYDSQKQNSNSYMQNTNNSNNRPNGSYSANPNKSPYQKQWHKSDYQNRPSERPYDSDNPNQYQKRPNLKPQDGHYINSEKNIPSHQEDQLTNLNHFPPTYTQGSVKNYDNYNRYPTTTSAYHQEKPISTTNSWTDVSSYLKGSNTRFPQSDHFSSHNPPFYQKPTSRPIYQKDNQSQPSLYTKESIDRPVVVTSSYEQGNSHKSPINLSELSDQLSSGVSQENRPTPTPHWSETSTINLYAHRQEEGFKTKPTKTYSVTIVTETIETVHQPDQIEFISQYSVTSELPRPLVVQTKTNTPVTRKSGQYYYDKNVLHRYPDRVVGQIPKNNHYLTIKNEETLIRDQGKLSEKLATKAIRDAVTNSKVIRDNESKSTVIPPVVITDYNNNEDDAVDDLKGDLSADVKSVTSTDISEGIYHWLDSQEDLNLPMLETPKITSDEFTNVQELPKTLN